MGGEQVRAAREGAVLCRRWAAGAWSGPGRERPAVAEHRLE